MHTITLDWLALTFTEMTENAHEFIHRYASSEGAAETAPTNGYRAAIKTSEGVVCMWNVDRPEMGYHVIFAGSAIRNLCEHMELDQKALVQEVIQSGGRVTRLDLATDMQGEPVSLDEIYKDLEQGKHSGTARTISQIHSVNGGNTIYVGSRTSEKFIRIYNKGAQVDVPNSLWFRFEIETKGMAARATASALSSYAQWHAVFKTLVLPMVNLADNLDYQRFFPKGLVPVGIPKLEKVPDREKWIHEQVIPAVTKHFIEHRDSYAVALLREMLDYLDKQE